MVAVVWWKRAGVLTDRRVIIRVLIGLWIFALGISVPNSVFWTTFWSEQDPKFLMCACKHPLPRDVSYVCLINIYKLIIFSNN